eukprot:CAMPEP_0183343656 /NCGR_PEP_ID=MMETSP0164_2-20130417/9520_1 /TAXON_ID=221442 /ORGANISM="Coccolithus pelagicus ssp braarudi, Strain PLY182g" /LENGTH=161 /DNA_ID=CAMNT_0025514523 /DNA_START=165 /DNA_END=650 /DNA_ORIENTATION=-
MAFTAQELKVPLIVTEQYPKGLGHTVEEIDLTANVNFTDTGPFVVEKTAFSMVCPGVKELLEHRDFTDAIVVGLEAHVCVQQTTLDLLSSGKNVHLCVDAISSQTCVDRACGLRRAERAGAMLTTTESVMMELIRSKDHPSFKAISGCLKTNRAENPLEPV